MTTTIAIKATMNGTRNPAKVMIAANVLISAFHPSSIPWTKLGESVDVAGSDEMLT
jgi:hypothetical protein